jgi:hypothetical protein
MSNKCCSQGGHAALNEILYNTKVALNIDFACGIISQFAKTVLGRHLWGRRYLAVSSGNITDVH